MPEFAAARRFAAIRQTEAYWMALAGNGRVPARRQIDPRGLEDVLDEVMIAECVAPGKARLRIAGGRFGALLGMDARGMVLSTLFAPEARGQLEAAVDKVIGGPGIVALDLISPGGPGRPRLDGALLLLPLRDDAGGISRLLGAIGLAGQIGRAPRSFELRGVASRELRALAETPPFTGRQPGAGRADAPRTAPGSSPAGRAEADTPAGFGEPAAEFDDRTRPTHVPWLRVVRND